MPKSNKRIGSTSKPRPQHPVAARRPPSAAVRAEILLEAGYMCANPRCRHILTLELHHICWVKDRGTNTASNLLALCPNCHSLHTAGHIPTSAIAVWKSMLSSINSTDRTGVDFLLYLHRTSVSGLIEQGGGAHGGGSGSYSSAFEIRLTNAGQRLVEAWLAGDPVALSKALHSNAK
jgi:hypothetical protein